MALHKTNIAIFASGTGTNAKKIIEYFEGDENIRVALVVSSKMTAGVVQIAKDAQIPVIFLEKDRFSTTGYVAELKEAKIDFIILAGFLWMVPPVLVQAYPDKIINIHPALLPAYGGKGMYGNAVHEAVVAAGEAESGITIHLVDEIYDNGRIIFQEKCALETNETPDSLAKKIHSLEHQFFPEVIADYIQSCIGTTN